MLHSKPWNLDQDQIFGKKLDLDTDPYLMNTVRKSVTPCLKNGEELVAGAEAPGIRPVCHQQQADRAQVQIPVVLRGQQAPVQVT
jgi:hypothetical protein